MRGQGVALMVALAGVAASAGAQSEEPAPEEPRTAEQFIEAAREVYSVTKPQADPCATPVGNEIVVCRRRDESESLRIATSPTERAYAAGEMPPDPIPQAPYVLGLPECGVEVVCHRVGRAPPPIYIIDLSALPEALTPEEAALVVRAEADPNPEAASPAEAP